MELRYAIIGADQLSSRERIILALKNEAFAFIRWEGVLRVNRELPHVQEVISIAQELWRIAPTQSMEDDFRADELYDHMEALTNEQAAMQLFRAWHAAIDQQRKQEAQEAARAWYETVYDPNGIDILDQIGTYNSSFVDALVSESRKGDKERDWGQAIFLWAYQMGQAAAK